MLPIPMLLQNMQLLFVLAGGAYVWLSERTNAEELIYPVMDFIFSGWEGVDNPGENHANDRQRCSSCDC